jgi:hypothetical protein
MLPDDVLLAIFDFYVILDVARNLFLQDMFSKPANEEIEAWQSLAHVCRRWRTLVFESPHRLSLQLVCTAKTSARHMLDIWPAFPFLIRENECLEGLDNIIIPPKHRDRVRQISLMVVTSSTLEKVWAAMQDSEQEPFPELAHLLLWSDRTAPVLPRFVLGWHLYFCDHLCVGSHSIPRFTENYFCLLPTSSIFTFVIFLIPGTFHPKQWSLFSPH